jgi:hypothetical protein
MCRELKREPAWVGAIRLAYTQGRVTAEDVIEEANLLPGQRRTVEDVLSTMAEKGLLVESADFESTGRYLVGPVLRRSAPSPEQVNHLSKQAVHQWG